MRAAVIEELGGRPRIANLPAPDPADGEALIELAAAPLNPADLAVASGTFWAGHPRLPYVVGLEGTGRVLSGSQAGALVYATGGGLGVRRNGAASERFVAPEASLIPLPEDADPAVTAALGTAGLAGWLPLAWRAGLQPGETVLVLGATGTAGGIAIQAARILGAAKVVAVGRNHDRLEELRDVADDVVALDEPDLPARLVEACAPGADVIYDILWGEPLVAALGAARTGARVVHVGTAAASTATLPSIRGSQLSILGYSNFGAPREVLVEAYLTMVRHAMVGTLRIDLTRVPFEEAGHGWDGLRFGRGKFVLVP